MAANTRECFSACIGKTIVGVLFDALPVTNRSLATGNRTLIFEEGWGLTLSDNGSYWLESAEEIDRAVSLKRDELRQTQDELAGVLKLAGRA